MHLGRATRKTDKNNKRKNKKQTNETQLPIINDIEKKTELMTSEWKVVEARLCPLASPVFYDGSQRIQNRWNNCSNNRERILMKFLMNKTAFYIPISLTPNTHGGKCICIIDFQSGKVIQLRVLSFNSRCPQAGMRDKSVCEENVLVNGEEVIKTLIKYCG